MRAAGYLNTFGLVEEFIVPFVLDEVQARVGGPIDEVGALLGFVEEELKHIALFHRFLRLARPAGRDGLGRRPVSGLSGGDVPRAYSRRRQRRALAELHEKVMETSPNVEHLTRAVPLRANLVTLSSKHQA